MRIVQIENGIELERLRQTNREFSHHNKLHYKPSTSHTVAISPKNEFARAISKFLDMPKREITKFDGNPVIFWNFVKNFEDLVDNDAIGYRTKLNYLIHYCKAEGKAVIKQCVFLKPEEGYYKALELLEEAFGQRHVVTWTFIEKLLEFPSVKNNDAALLRKSSHELQARELTFKQMNYASDLNSVKTNEQLVLKLPVHSQKECLKVVCNVIKSGREPSFVDLCLFVKEQSDMAYTRYGLLINGHSTGKNSESSLRRKNLIQNTERF
ncbi:unnamed protein product [Trichobilharzia regenti]|nr:unnamed protein product [Trichobilharzia regenti]